MPYFPPFTTLLETSFSPSTTSDIFSDLSSLEPHSLDAHDATPLKSPDSGQSKTPAHASPLELH